MTASTPLPPTETPSQRSRSQGASPAAPAQVIAVTPAEAARLLSLGVWRVYALMRTGALQSYLDGRARRILLTSLHAYVARQLAAADSGWQTWQHNPRAQAQRAAPKKAGEGG